MVLEIRLSNFFSINEEVILDLRAGNINTEKSKSLSNNIFKYDDIEVLKTIALYGANASGKSNIIKTIRFCNAMVFESHKHNENSIFNDLSAQVRNTYYYQISSYSKFKGESELSYSDSGYLKITTSNINDNANSNSNANSNDNSICSNCCGDYRNNFFSKNDENK